MNQRPLAGLKRRFLASIIDAIFVGTPIAFALVQTVPADGSDVWLLPIYVVFGIYEIGTTALFGQTLGKRALSIRVTTDPSRSAPPSFRNATMRWAIRTFHPLYLLLFVGLTGNDIGTIAAIGTLMVAVTLASSPTRQGLHDRAAGTWVVKAKPQAR